MVAAAIFPVGNGALFLWLFSVSKCNNQGNILSAINKHRPHNTNLERDDQSIIANKNAMQNHRFILFQPRAG
jgi:hypothetical protein